MNVLEGCVSGLSRRTYNQVVCALEHTSPLSKHWAGLAEVLGFPTVEIQAIKQVHGDSFTVRMLDTWERSGKSSVKKLIIALACLGRVDCVWILQEDSALQGVAFEELRRTGEELKENVEEREKMFPTFLGGELEVFPAARHHCPPTSRVSLREQASSQQSAAGGAASSPNEESPPSSQTQSEAPGISSSRREVFISYYPDPHTITQVECLRDQLVANGFSVHYATEQQMMDGEFKSWAVQRAYNIIILCTQRYFDEDQRLSAQARNTSGAHSNKRSKIAIDRKLTQDLFFSPGEDGRILCIYLDQDCKNVRRCIPNLFRSRTCHSYPSEVVDIFRYLEDKPRFQAPTPVARIPVESEKIDYAEDLERFLAKRRRARVMVERERDGGSGRLGGVGADQSGGECTLQWSGGALRGNENRQRNAPLQWNEGSQQNGYQEWNGIPQWNDGLRWNNGLHGQWNGGGGFQRGDGPAQKTSLSKRLGFKFHIRKAWK